MNSHIPPVTDEQVVAWMHDFVNRNGYPPSVREVAAFTGYKSSADGHRILLRLQSKGLIERAPTVNRGIRIRTARMKADTEEM